MHVLLVKGGQSAEHEISLRSAENILKGLKDNNYSVTEVLIERSGIWYHLPSKKPLAIIPGKGKQAFFCIQPDSPLPPIDVVFPILHGPGGEDGTIQGLLRMINIPFVGHDILGSAVSMDKEAMKVLLKGAGLPIANYFVVHRTDSDAIVQQKMKNFKFPLFVKPANMGSSVGVSKVMNEAEFKLGLEKALQYDTKVLVEEFIHAREIEVSVLGSTNLLSSMPGEIAANHSYYSYDAKYLDPNGATQNIPALLDPNLFSTFQELATRAHQALFGEGLSRVDFFYTKEGKIYINELNSMPGFTSISQYPKLMEHAGFDIKQVTGQLIQFAISRFEQRGKLKLTQQ